MKDSKKNGNYRRSILKATGKVKAHFDYSHIKDRKQAIWSRWGCRNTLVINNPQWRNYLQAPKKGVQYTFFITILPLNWGREGNMEALLVKHCDLILWSKCKDIDFMKNCSLSDRYSAQVFSGALGAPLYLGVPPRRILLLYSWIKRR